MMLLAVISEGALLRRKPPFLPLTVVTKPGGPQGGEYVLQILLRYVLSLGDIGKEDGLSVPLMCGKVHHGPKAVSALVDIFIASSTPFTCSRHQIALSEAVAVSRPGKRFWKRARRQIALCRRRQHDDYGLSLVLRLTCEPGGDVHGCPARNSAQVCPPPGRGAGPSRWLRRS